MSHSYYYDLEAMQGGVDDHRHREVIGGLWEEIGALQMSFLLAQGLKPEHRLMDVGCGSLRLGVKAIPYLEANRYYGTDLNEILIRAGYERELSPEMQARVPMSHFGVNEDFGFDFLDQKMDVAIAQSVFTHLPLNYLRRCLNNLAPHMNQGGRFFVTYFECREGQNLFSPIEQPNGGVITHDYQDPFHYRRADLSFAVEADQWGFEPIGDWNHPRGQQMACFRKL